MRQAAVNKTIFRPGDRRGITQLGWLHSRHAFSFGQYHDPANTGFRSLRVINDDVISPGTGFGEHGHDNMEILTWVVDGALRHDDSLGHSQLLKPGELQAMSAGAGIRHSEYNGSKTQPTHFLQIWIEPDKRDVEPRYDQQRFDAEGRRNRWQTLASGTGTDGVLPIHRDAVMRVADLDAGVSLDIDVKDDRYAYAHVVTGSVQVERQALVGGDAFTAEQDTRVTLRAAQPAQVIWFDLS